MARKEAAPPLQQNPVVEKSHQFPTFLSALVLGTIGSAYTHHDQNVALIISGAAVAVPVASYVIEKLKDQRPTTRQGVKYGKFVLAGVLAALSSPDLESALVIPPVLVVAAAGAKIATGTLRQSLSTKRNTPILSGEGDPSLDDDYAHGDGIPDDVNTRPIPLAWLSRLVPRFHR